MDTDGNLASAAEGVEDGAFRLHRKAGVCVVQGGHGAADDLVALGFGKGSVVRCAGFQGQSSLPGRGTELVDGEALVDPLGAAKAVQAGGGEH